MGGVKRLAVTCAAGCDFHDPAGADPGLADVIWSLYRFAKACGHGAQRPGDITAVANLVIRCHERDSALSLELGADLPLEGFLVAFDAQEEVGPLLLELPKNGRWVWSASAWISTSSRSSSPSSWRSTARSWFSPVA